MLDVNNDVLLMDAGCLRQDWTWSEQLYV